MLYYIIYNNTQQGPMNKEELVKYGLNYNSDVWAEGLPSWVKASEIAELKVFIDSLNSKQNAEDDYYFMIINGQQCGPFAKNELKSKGLLPTSHVWKTGMSDWMPAAQVPELQSLFQGQTPPPYMGTAYVNHNQSQHQYAPGQEVYNHQYQNIPHKDWLPWAIVSTVLGLFCSCIGSIFGIIAIIKANSANRLYREGSYQQAEAENSSAKTMTIIGFAIAIIGIIGNIIYYATLW